ncbi:hypothetical protein EDB80DRAFT_877217 [Ilyonectria destructans]|nr:hypothetical protein EDB80DRAFT_877217 [Ilyonectria destructans]
MVYICNASDIYAPLEPYGDVSGPGAIAGFLGTAYLAVGLVILHYIFAFDPDEDLFQTELPTTSHEPQGPRSRKWSANPIDKLAKRGIQWAFRLCGLSNAQLLWMRSPRFAKAILMMCDIQILTGIGILLSGYIALGDGLSAYHFQLIVRIAWFSNITHLAGLSVLRNYLHNHPVEKWARLSLIIVLTILLLVSMVPTLFFNWIGGTCSASLAGSKAICFLDSREALKLYNNNCTSSVDFGDSIGTATGKIPHIAFSETRAFHSGLVSMLLVFFNLLSRLIKLLAFTSTAAKTLRKRHSNAWKSIIRRTVLNRKFKYQGHLMAQMTLFIMCRIYLDFVLSSLSDVYWLLVSTVWGTLKLFEEKSHATVDENDWTFGQILPVFLLIGPVYSLALTVLEAKRQKQSDIQHNAEDSNLNTDAAGVELMGQPEHSIPDAEQDNSSTQELMANSNPEGTLVNHFDEVNQLLDTIFEKPYNLAIFPGANQTVFLV